MRGERKIRAQLRRIQFVETFNENGGLSESFDQIFSRVTKEFMAAENNLSCIDSAKIILGQMVDFLHLVRKTSGTIPSRTSDLPNITPIFETFHFRIEEEIVQNPRSIDNETYANFLFLTALIDTIKNNPDSLPPSPVFADILKFYEQKILQLWEEGDINIKKRLVLPILLLDIPVDQNPIYQFFENPDFDFKKHEEIIRYFAIWFSYSKKQGKIIYPLFKKCKLPPKKFLGIWFYSTDGLINNGLNPDDNMVDFFKRADEQKKHYKKRYIKCIKRYMPAQIENMYKAQEERLCDPKIPKIIIVSSTFDYTSALSDEPFIKELLEANSFNVNGKKILVTIVEIADQRDFLSFLKFLQKIHNLKVLIINSHGSQLKGDNHLSSKDLQDLDQSLNTGTNIVFSGCYMGSRAEELSRLSQRHTVFYNSQISISKVQIIKTPDILGLNFIFTAGIGTIVRNGKVQTSNIIGFQLI